MLLGIRQNFSFVLASSSLVETVLPLLLDLGRFLCNLSFDTPATLLTSVPELIRPDFDRVSADTLTQPHLTVFVRRYLPHEGETRKSHSCDECAET
jgi:hypothetical protein